MIELKSKNTINKAIERARAERKNLIVRRTNASRMYRVENRATGGSYLVNFFISNNRRFAHCSCPAGLQNMACKHVAAAAALNICLAEQGLLNRKATSAV
ncbi:MAG: hypothetical protein M3209_00050 [Acidobacteriota bacterium]|nr:hypothetical protein [Acidobacteriota bacterium]